MTTDETFIPIHASYWVISGRFRAGEYPGAIEDGESRQRLSWLLWQGTNVIFDLTEEGEPDLHPYLRLLQEECTKAGRAIVHKRMSLKDYCTPTREMVVEILDMIDLALSLGRNVYLHCCGGKGRTGTIVGCYLVRHGMEGRQALEKIQSLRSAVTREAEQSPETEGQIRMVLEWKLGQ